jgi:putative ABC transport system permease protein
MTIKSFLQIVAQDLRFAFKSLHKNAAFSASVILTVALGIGANTAMFSVIRAVLLKPLPYPEAGRVVLMAEGATPVRFEEMKTASRSYTAIGDYAGGFEDMALSGAGEPEVLKAARVSSNFLDILGVAPLRGRSFLAEEDERGAPAVAMISAGLWQRRFGSDPSIAGKTITLAGLPHTIVGVLPPGFQFPMTGADVWIPRPEEWSAFSPESRALSPTLVVFGQLKTGVTLAQANAEFSVLQDQYAAAHPTMLDAKPDAPRSVQPLREALISDVRPKLWILFGAVSFVLLIVCANVASLLLARATTRAREFAVRAAIGAGRGRIIGQLLVESLLLSGIGGLLGIAFAAGSLRGIRSMTFVDVPRSGEIGIDATVLGFGAALAIVTGTVFGLVPSIVASQPNLARILRGSGESASGDESKRIARIGSRGVLVMGQVALSIVLLIGATLLIESLARVYRVDPGFQPAGLLTMKLSLSPTRYDSNQKRAAFYQQVVERIGALPGVRGAGVTLTLPMDNGWMGTTLELPGRPPRKLNERPIAIFQNITPGFLHTMGIALKRGRDFTVHDNLGAAPVVVINESAAHTFWPDYPAGPDPVGQFILFGSDPKPSQIVGITADVHEAGKDTDTRAGVYVPCLQKPPVSAMLAVRASGDPLSLADAVRERVLEVDHDQPVSQISTMDVIVDDSEGQLRLMMRLLGGFAGTATFLSVLGLYAVISYSVAQRTREMGIRRALGAQRGDILRLMLKHGLLLSLVGVLLGNAGAFAVTRLLRDLLFQVSPTDLTTFAGVSGLFVVVALAASLIPARRAAAVDPQVALRIV